MTLNEGERRWERLIRRYEDARPALAALGVQPDGAAQVAEQRALRAYLASTGQPMPSSITLITVDDRGLVTLLSSVWMDGLGVGLASDPRVCAPESVGLPQLSASVRSVDALSDSGMQLPQILARFGIGDVNAAMDIGMRRARLYAQLPNSPLRPKADQMTVTVLSAGAWVDAVSAGRACLQLLDEGLSTRQPPDEELS